MQRVTSASLKELCGKMLESAMSLPSPAHEPDLNGDKNSSAGSAEDEPTTAEAYSSSPSAKEFICDEKINEEEPRELLRNWSRTPSTSKIDERREEQEEKAVLQEFALWLRKLATAAASQVSVDDEWI